MHAAVGMLALSARSLLHIVVYGARIGSGGTQAGALSNILASFRSAHCHIVKTELTACVKLPFSFSNSHTTYNKSLCAGVGALLFCSHILWK